MLIFLSDEVKQLTFVMSTGNCWTWYAAEIGRALRVPPGTRRNRFGAQFQQPSAVNDSTESSTVTKQEGARTKLAHHNTEM